MVVPVVHLLGADAGRRSAAAEDEKQDDHDGSYGQDTANGQQAPVEHSAALPDASRQRLLGRS